MIKSKMRTQEPRNQLTRNVFENTKEVSFNIVQKVTVKCFGSGILLLVIVTLPSLLMNMGYASSMSLGLAFVLAIIFFLYIISDYRLYSSNASLVISLAITVVCLVSAISLIQNDQFDFDRFCKTFAFLLTFLLGAYCLTVLFRALTEREIDFAAKIVFYALTSCIFVTILGFGGLLTPEGLSEKPVLLFIEPSHLAIVFLPFLLYQIITTRGKKKIYYILLIFIAAMLIQNATLLLGCILAAVIALPIRTFLIFGFSGILYSYLFGINYFFERLDFIESNNESALAYLSGWERAYLNFKETLGIGVGFQQFGIIGSKGQIMNILNDLGAPDLCLKDGATVGSKVIGEFGTLGILCIAIYIIYCIKGARYLSNISANKILNVSRHNILFQSFFVMYIVDILVRGTAYFSSASFIFIASLIWIINQSKQNTLTSGSSDL